MSVVSIAEARPTPGWWPAQGKPFTVAELDRMPGDGRRYELLDGALIVSPRPAPAHQVVAFTLATALDRACPPRWQVVPEPAVRISRDTEFAPDLDKPELAVFELRAGRYEEAARVSGDEPFAAVRPFQIEVIPACLVAGLQPR